MIDRLTSVHPHALVEKGAIIGKSTRVWAFAHVSSGVEIGDDCNICDHTFIERGVKIGHRVTIKCGVYLWDGIEIADDVFVGPSATFTNDSYPRSKQYLPEYNKTLLHQGCSIGANSTILSNLQIGVWALVGAGSVVTKDVPAYALVYGNPAQIKGWVCSCGKKLKFNQENKAICDCGKGYLFDLKQKKVYSHL